jgi:hypothetical protein
MGGDWYDSEDNGFTEEERALQALREMRDLPDPDQQCPDCERYVKRPGRCAECAADVMDDE